MVAMAAKPGRWRLRQALGLRLLLTTVLQAVSGDPCALAPEPVGGIALKKMENSVTFGSHTRLP